MIISLKKNTFNDENFRRSGWESLEGHSSPEKDFATLPLKLQLLFEKELILR